MVAAVQYRQKRRRHPLGDVIRDVELFASGLYRGKTYTADDINEIAENFDKLGPNGLGLLDPPAVIGHEEDQEYLERSDLPAAGWVVPGSIRVRNYTDPKHGRQAVLIGDVGGMAKQVANNIRRGKFRKISAEIYPAFRDDHGEAHGKALRRVAFLGAEVPQVKRIADLPLPEPETYAERSRWCRLTPRNSLETRFGTVICFAEVGMKREDMKQMIQMAMPSLLPATLNTFTDDILADLVKNLPSVPQNQSNKPPGSGQANPLGEGSMSREDLIAELTAMGEDPQALSAMTDEELQAVYEEKAASGGGAAPPPGGGTPAMMGDDEEMEGESGAASRDEMIAELTAMGEPAESLQGMSDEELAALLAQMSGAQAAPAAPAAFSERRGGYRTAAELAAVYARRNLATQVQVARRTQRMEAERFCEDLVRQGRIFPAMKALVMDHLMRGDNLEVQTFSEGGKKVRATQFEKIKQLWSRSPVVVKFGERIASAKSGSTQANTEQKQIVERFAETLDLPKFGLTKEKYVNDFLVARAKNKSFTAVDYGVPRDFVTGNN